VEESMTQVAILIGLLAAPVLISHIVEALRSKPEPPKRLEWAPSVSLRYVTVGGLRVRFLATGEGPVLVLLHTLRTQLDVFQKVIPELARHFTIYAVDYPGHGWSDIPRADYTPAFFTRFVSDFLETLEIEDALLAGVSIGASIPLQMAAEGNRRIRGVVSINPYDYGKRGADRANVVAKIIYTLAAVPVVGEMVMRFRTRMVLRKVLEGGVVTPLALPPAFTDEVVRAGDRPGHYAAFLKLIRHMPLWRKAHEVYGRIKVPVLLVYGDRVWSRESERQETLRAIPGARLITVKNGGHFLPLDRPEAVVEHIKSFAHHLESSSRT
jgi:pimeloyl-ACP methyl ester carboxylesterase